MDSDDFVDGKSFEMAISDMEKGIDVISFGIVRYYDEDTKKILSLNMRWEHICRMTFGRKYSLR